MKDGGTHLSWLEAESIHILRESAAEGRKPVMLFSAGKDSTVLAHLARRAFYPAPPPFPLLYVGSTWEFAPSWNFAMPSYASIVSPWSFMSTRKAAPQV